MNAVTASILIHTLTAQEAELQSQVAELVPLHELVAKYQPGYDGDYDALFPQLTRCAVELDVAAVPALMALMDQASAIAEKAWEDGREHGAPAYAAVSCANVVWWLEPALGLERFWPLWERRIERPILAGVALQMVARTPLPDEVTSIASAVGEMQRQFESALHVHDVVQMASEGAAAHSRTCHLVARLQVVEGFDESTAWLMELSSNAPDWMDGAACAEITRVTGQSRGPFDPGRCGVPADAYWARQEIKKRSADDPERLGRTLASLKRSLRRRPGDEVDPALDVLFSKRTTQVVVERWITAEAKDAFIRASQ